MPESVDFSGECRAGRLANNLDLVGADAKRAS